MSGWVHAAAGAAGVTYAHMLSTYEATVEAHLRLLRRGLRP